MNITDKQYFEQYQLLIGKDIPELVKHFDFSRHNSNVGYQTQASAVYSSNIEGNSINLNSFMNYKLSKEKFKPQKELQQIEDLISAYEYAQAVTLSEKALLKAHKLLSKQLLIASFRGKYRNDKVGVFGQAGLVYLAVEAEYVSETMQAFFKEINLLLSLESSVIETFYYASLIHLRFAHVHPFRDGNGRTARLLEKWFLAQKLGSGYWNLPAEKYYRDHQLEYYNSINLGVNFYELNYDNCLPFLIMLPNSLK